MPYVTRDGGSVVNGWSKWDTTGGGQEFLDLPDAEITTFNAIGDTLPVTKPVLTGDLTFQTEATQAEMETATDTTKVVTPEKVNFHPGTSKTWVQVDQTGTPAIIASHNVSSITDTGTGLLKVTFDTDFSGATVYTAVGMGSLNTRVQGQTTSASSNMSAGNMDLKITDSGTTATDAEMICVIFLGDQ